MNVLYNNIDKNAIVPPLAAQVIHALWMLWGIRDEV